MVQNILFDLDETLLDFKRSESRALSNMLRHIGVEPTEKVISRYSEINKSRWKLLEQGKIEQSVLRVRRFEDFLKAVGKTGDAQKMCDTFVDALGQQSVLLPGALQAVERWSKRVPVIIVTNGISEVQRSRMAKSELNPLISGLVISSEVGAAKPAPLMLEKAMELAGVADKRRALMLGDSLSSDIAAAKNAGVDACWFNPKGLKNDKGLPIAYDIRSLDEVDAILRGEEN